MIQLNNVSLEGLIQTNELLFGIESNIIPIKDPRPQGVYDPKKYKKEISPEDEDFLEEIMGGSSSATGGEYGRPPRQPEYNQDYLKELRGKKESLEREIGIKIDVDTYANGVPLALFESDDVVNAFRDAASKIPVSKRYLRRIVFRDMPKDVGGGYLREDQTIYLPRDVSEQFLSNGGLHHEFAHGKLAEFGNPVEIITATPREYRLALSESYEEVAADILAYGLAEDKRDFTELVKGKHKIYSEFDAEEFVLDMISVVRDDLKINGISYRRIDKIAEALAIFDFIGDRATSSFIEKTIAKYRNKFNTDEIALISNLRGLYSSMNTADKQKYNYDLNKAASLLSRGWNIK